MQDVANILARYPQVRATQRITPVPGGFSGACVFRVEGDGREYCVRQWPEPGLRPSRLRELHRLLAFLFDRGLTQVAVPLASAGGDTLIEHRGRLWQVEPWMPGQADFEDRPSDSRLRNAMRTLARLHCAAADYVPTEAGRRWFFQAFNRPSPAIVERLALIREWDAERVQKVLAAARRLAHDPFEELTEGILSSYTQIAPAIVAELATLRTVEVRLHSCLRDVWHDHVLYMEDEVTGIIDPAAARSENVASDLSRLLGSLLGDDPLRWEFALGAYSEVRPLTEDERRLVRALDRSSILLSGLIWVVNRCRPGVEIRLTPRIHERLVRNCERLRMLAHGIGGL